VLGALGHEVEEVLEEADALEHEEGGARDEAEVDEEVDEVPRRHDHVAHQGHQDRRQRREAGGPGGADGPADAAALVLEDHVADGEERHDAQEGEGVAGGGRGGGVDISGARRRRGGSGQRRREEERSCAAIY
jgi:hypothetical protein